MLLDPQMRAPKPLIPKPAKSFRFLNAASAPGCETPAISAGADAARRALCPRPKVAGFYAALLAGFCSAVDTHIHDCFAPAAPA
jgi:hypothetical protein